MSVIETTPERDSWSTTQSAPWISEDWLSVVIGLAIFVLALALLVNVDLIGWVVTTTVWINPGQALGTASTSYAPLGGAAALVATHVALLVVLSVATLALRADVKKFALAFTGVLDRLCELDRGQLRHPRRGHAGRHAEVRDQLVAAADQRRRLHLRGDCRARDRQ